MVAFKNSSRIKANSSFCTFRFSKPEHQTSTKHTPYQHITRNSSTQHIAHFVFMPIPGHITRKYRLMKDNPKNTIVYTLPESEAYSASSSGEESGIQPNAWFDIICRKGLSEDMIWKRMMNIATTYFENIEVRDKTAGWLKSGWVYNKFKYETVRTRLEIRLSFTDENVLSYRARIVSEIKDNDCSSSDCYVKYGRTMHRFDPIVLELQTSVGGGE